MKHVVYILIILFCLPVVFGADITGWGSSNFFLNSQHNTFFTTDIDGAIPLPQNQTITTGTIFQPIVCQLDTRTTANELITATSGTVRVYSLRGNVPVLLDSYNAVGTITAIGCLGDKLYIGEPSLRVMHMVDGKLETFGTSGVGDVVSINANYDNNRVVVLHNQSIFLYNENAVSLFSDGIGYDTSLTAHSWNWATSTEVQYINDELVYLWDKTSERVYIVNTTTADGGDLSTFRDVSGGTHASAPPQHVVFGDFNGNGEPLFCRWFLSRPSTTGTISVACWDKTNTQIGTRNFKSSSASVGFNSMGVFDTTFTGANNIVVSWFESFSGSEGAVWNPHTNSLSTVAHIFSGGTTQAEKVRGGLNQQESLFIASGNFLTLLNNTVIKDLSSEFTNPFYTFADVTGDNVIDVIVSDETKTMFFFEGDVDPELSATITFANNVINGGFFGYYVGDTCQGTTVTFRAQECVGDLQVCNYFNSITERERLVTDCGTGTYTEGSFSQTSPSVSCTYNSLGAYDVVLYIQGESTQNNVTSNSNVPIRVNVANTPNCNGVQITQPPQTNESTGDSGSTQPPTDTNGVAPPTPNGQGQALADNFVENILLIVAFIMIIAPAITLVMAKVTHPFILMVASILMAFFTSVLGLISFNILVFTIIIIVAISVVVGLLFKPSGMGGVSP